MGPVLTQLYMLVLQDEKEYQQGCTKELIEQKHPQGKDRTRKVIERFHHLPSNPFSELIISNINHNSPAMRKANTSPPFNRFDPHVEAMPRLGRDTPFYV